MISIVCVYNNKEILENFLLKSLKNQSTEYELILMDNTEVKFKSAAEALNKGGKKAKGDYIMFVHQDVDLSSINWLKESESILDSIENLGIAGVAGRSKSKPWAITNIKDGIPPGIVSPETINEPISVQTLDECLVLIPNKLFKDIKFDEEVCDDWHLYTVDYSLSIQKIGYDVYVIPMFLYHRSKAYSLSERYYDTLKKVLAKHHKNKVILTTVGDWLTFYPLSMQKRFPGFKNKLISIFK
jgi:GT2 family glycosyltransferase